MARIVCISKYPPLEGGIAAKTYWLAQALGERGHYIHVVTDRKDADEVHTVNTTTSIPNHANIAVHRPPQRVPWHIPHSEQRALSLLDKAVELIEREQPDLIEAGYLVPYGVVAYLASKITGVPYVLRHGGSDVKKFVEAGLWPSLWKKVLSTAECVITDVDHRPEIERWNARSRVILPYVPDPAIFRPVIREERERPVLALIGKANYHWEHKGWHRVVDIWSKMGENFEFTVVSQGNGLDRFKAYARRRLGNRVKWRQFLPPWEMSQFLSSVDACFHFETDLPFPVFSNLVLEALSCGTVVISDQPDLVAIYERNGLDLGELEELILVVPAENARTAADKIEGVISSRSVSENQYLFSEYKEYLAANELVLRGWKEREKL